METVYTINDFWEKSEERVFSLECVSGFVLGQDGSVAILLLDGSRIITDVNEASRVAAELSDLNQAKSFLKKVAAGRPFTYQRGFTTHAYGSQAENPVIWKSVRVDTSKIDQYLEILK